MPNIADTKLSRRVVATAAAMLFSTAALAHEAHVHQHGLASLEITQQDATVVATFRSPLDSLIGFETRPANDEQRALATKLLDLLKDSGTILSLPAAAGCTQQSLDIDAPTLKPDDDDHDGGNDEHDRDRHDHDNGDHDSDRAGHRHGDDDPEKAGRGRQQADDEPLHAKAAGRTIRTSSAKPVSAHRHDADDRHEDDDHDQEGDDHDGHDGDAHDGHDHDREGHDGHDHAGHQHADLSVSYTFRCRNPAAIDRVTLPVFRNWPRLHAVDAAVVNDKGQRAERLTPSSTSIAW